MTRVGFIPEIEQHLLGAVLSGGDHRGALARIAPEQFEEPSHRELWRLCQAAQDSYGSTTIPTVARMASTEFKAGFQAQTGTPLAAYMAGTRDNKVLPIATRMPLLDGIEAGVTRDEWNAFRGVEKAYPAELTWRPRPESYAGQERGEGYVAQPNTSRNAALDEILGINSSPWNETDGPAVRTQADQRRTTPMSTAAISYAGQERGQTPSVATNQQSQVNAGTLRNRNLTPGIDTSLTALNAFTPVTTRDGSKVISIADLLYGDEMTTELPGGTRRNIPSAGMVGEAEAFTPNRNQTPNATRTGSTRQANLLDAVLGDSGGWNALLDGPTTRPGSSPTRRQPEANTMTATNTPGFFRVSGGQAGTIGLPSDVRPDVEIPDFTAEWSERGPTVRTWDNPEDGGSWELFTDTFQPTRQPAATEQKPNPFAYVQPPNPVVKPTNLSQEPSGQTPRYRTVSREQRYENPDYTSWRKVNANTNATPADIPLGEMNYGARNRDSKPYVHTTMPEQWLTRQVQVQVPITPAKPVAQAYAPVVKPAVGAKPQPNPLQAAWGNPLQAARGLFNPQQGPLATVLGIMTPQRSPSEYWMTATGLLDDGVSENHRTPSIGVGK
jgi:hypothetical protein